MIFEWFQSLCIIFLFFILLCINLFGTSIQSIQDNWPIYRCTPIMLPFAGFISPDGSTTSDNFSYCIQSIMTSFAPTITQPFSYLQSMTSDMMESINTSNENTTDQQSEIKTGVSDIVQNLYGVFINVIIEFNMIVIKMIDTQGKLSGIMAAMMHIMTSVQYTFQSMWDGIPGVMIRTIANLT